MRLYSKKLSSVTKAEIVKLSKLTIKQDSMMKSDILRAKNNRESIRIFIIKDQGEIVAWSSVLPSNIYYYQLRAKQKGGKPVRYAKIYTFVKRDYRGRGLGKRLIKNASKWAKENKFTPKVFAWNKNSFKFFKSCANRGLTLNVVNYSGYRV